MIRKQLLTVVHAVSQTFFFWTHWWSNKFLEEKAKKFMSLRSIKTRQYFWCIRITPLLAESSNLSLLRFKQNIENEGLLESIASLQASPPVIMLVVENERDVRECVRLEQIDFLKTRLCGEYMVSVKQESLLMDTKSYLCEFEELYHWNCLVHQPKLISPRGGRRRLSVFEAAPLVIQSNTDVSPLLGAGARPSDKRIAVCSSSHQWVRISVVRRVFLHAEKNTVTTPFQCLLWVGLRIVCAGATDLLTTGILSSSSKFPLATFFQRSYLEVSLFYLLLCRCIQFRLSNPPLILSINVAIIVIFLVLI